MKPQHKWLFKVHLCRSGSSPTSAGCVGWWSAGPGGRLRSAPGATTEITLGMTRRACLHCWPILATDWSVRVHRPKSSTLTLPFQDQEPGAVSHEPDLQWGPLLPVPRETRVILPVGEHIPQRAQVPTIKSPPERKAVLSGEKNEKERKEKSLWIRLVLCWSHRKSRGHIWCEYSCLPFRQSSQDQTWKQACACGRSVHVADPARDSAGTPAPHGSSAGAPTRVRWR